LELKGKTNSEKSVLGKIQKIGFKNHHTDTSGTWGNAEISRFKNNIRGERKLQKVLQKIMGSSKKKKVGKLQKLGCQTFKRRRLKTNRTGVFHYIKKEQGKTGY